MSWSFLVDFNSDIFGPSILVICIRTRSWLEIFDSEQGLLNAEIRHHRENHLLDIFRVWISVSKLKTWHPLLLHLAHALEFSEVDKQRSIFITIQHVFAKHFLFEQFKQWFIGMQLLTLVIKDHVLPIAGRLREEVNALGCYHQHTKFCVHLISLRIVSLTVWLLLMLSIQQAGWASALHSFVVGWGPFSKVFDLVSVDDIVVRTAFAHARLIFIFNAWLSALRTVCLLQWLERVFGTDLVVHVIHDHWILE